MATFDLYEYVGYIVPGSVLLVCLMPFCPWIRAKFSGGEFAQIGGFLVASFLLGHFLHALVHGIEGQFRLACEDGVYGENLVLKGDRSVLTTHERENFAVRVKSEFGVDIDDQKTLATDDGYLAWCNATMRIEEAVSAAKRRGGLDTFIKDYGLYLGLMAAFALVLVTCVAVTIVKGGWLLFGATESAWDRLVISKSFKQALILALIAVIAGGISYYRFEYFGRIFTRELFLSFLGLPHDIPGYFGPG
jgi:hypothetical protein